MAAEVFFTDMRASSRLNLLDKLIRLFQRAGLGRRSIRRILWPLNSMWESRAI